MPSVSRQLQSPSGLIVTFSIVFDIGVGASPLSGPLLEQSGDDRLRLTVHGRQWDSRWHRERLMPSDVGQRCRGGELAATASRRRCRCRCPSRDGRIVVVGPKTAEKPGLKPNIRNIIRRSREAPNSRLLLRLMPRPDGPRMADLKPTKAASAGRRCPLSRPAAPRPDESRCAAGTIRSRSSS